LTICRLRQPIAFSHIFNSGSDMEFLSSLETFCLLAL
jgi:hypothetical protein